TREKTPQTQLNEEEPELVDNPFMKDTAKPAVSPPEDNERPLMAAKKDSLPIEKDTKISESMYSVSAFETITPTDSKTPNVSNGMGSDNIKAGIRKTRSSSIKVEFWQSIVNFKGYKLSGSNLELFDVKPEENVGFKYLDNKLYLKKN